MSSNENIKLSLSMAMDNEVDEFELQQLLNSIDQGAKSIWARYQLVRSVLKNEVVFPTLDLTSSISDAIEKEEKPNVKCFPYEKSKGYILRQHAIKFAVAASVMALSLSTLYLYNKSHVNTTDPFSTMGNVAVVADNEQWVESKLMDLVDRHERQGVLAFVDYDKITVNNQ